MCRLINEFFLFLFSVIVLDKFARRITNNENTSLPQELENIKKFLRLDNDQIEISLNQVKQYLKKYFSFYYFILFSVLHIYGQMQIQHLTQYLVQNVVKI